MALVPERFKTFGRDIARLISGTRQLAQLAQLSKQTVAKRALRSKFVEQGFSPIESFRIIVRFLEDLPVATLDFGFCKQNKLLRIKEKYNINSAVIRVMRTTRRPSCPS
jgi:hypothetical protein